MMLVGDLLAVLSAFVFAFGAVAVAKGAERRSGESGVMLSILMSGAFGLVGWLVAGVPASSYLDGSLPVGAALFWFAASGLFASVWGRLTLFKAVQYAGVVRASTIRRLTPLFSVLLAWLILDERISPLGGAGMAILMASIALLMLDSRRKLSEPPNWPGADIPRGYAFGVVCALSYSASYVVRKSGLDAVPDAYMGVFVSSVAALGYYFVGCLFSATYRSVVRQALSRPDFWQFVAAFCISAGQIIQFIALTFTTVSRVAMINSIEVFVSAYLAIAIFKTEKRPSNLVLAASAAATLGVILVAAG